MLKTIEIKNIKGIQNKSFPLNIIPNKPSLLVAPNGFGKSSFAIAFKSMNNNRIMLSDEDCFEQSNQNLPQINVEFVRTDGTEVTLSASNTTNSISNEIDYFVINNPIIPRGIASQYGRASATLEINDIVLVQTIPVNTSFNYSYTAFRERFGRNSKVLPNINPLLSNKKFVEKLSQKYEILNRANGQRVQNKVNELIEAINRLNGTSEQLLNHTDLNCLNELNQTPYINELSTLINDTDTGYTHQTQNVLASIQLIWLYIVDQNRFKNASKYSNYQLDRHRLDTILGAFNNTWKNIRTTENNGRLKIKFPKANQISNGQRDILTFISMLFKARRSLKKESNILIIDEVFDYLDDANLTAAQYYITQLILEYTVSGKRLYPLILTHLNPNYFKNFAFSNQKVYYLDKSDSVPNQHLVKLLRNRNHESIKEDVAKHLLHYSPENINKRNEFRNLRLRELWGVDNNFIEFINDEANNYLTGNQYCPFAVCGAVRVKIEELTYNRLNGNDAQLNFLNTNKTRDKLKKAEEMGVVSPESYYLLGIVYNEGMHWKENTDNISPISSKLENLTIKKLIQDLFAEN